LIPAYSEYEITVLRLRNVTGALGISSSELGETFLRTEQNAITALLTMREFIPAGIRGQESLTAFADAAFRMGIFTGEGTARAAKGFRDIVVSLTDVGASTGELNELQLSIEHVTAVTGQSVEKLGQFVRATSVMAEFAGISKEGLLSLAGAATMLGDRSQEVASIQNRLIRQMYLTPGALMPFMAGQAEFYSAMWTKPENAIRMFAEQVDKIDWGGPGAIDAVLLFEQMGFSVERDVPLLRELNRTFDVYRKTLAETGSEEAAWLAHQKEVERQNNTLRNSLVTLRGVLDNLNIVLGEAFTPIVKAVADVIKGLTKTITDLPEPIRQSLLTAASLSGVFILLPPIITAVGSAVTFLLTTLTGGGAVMSSVGVTVTVAAVAFALLGTALGDTKRAAEILMPAVVGLFVALRTSTPILGALTAAFMVLSNEGISGLGYAVLAVIPVIMAFRMSLDPISLRLTMLGAAVAVLGLYLSSMGAAGRVASAVIGGLTVALGIHLVATVASTVATVSLATALTMLLPGLGLIIGGIIAIGAAFFGTTTKAQRMAEAQERLKDGLVRTNEQIMASDRLLIATHDHLLDKLGQLPVGLQEKYFDMVYKQGKTSAEALREVQGEARKVTEEMSKAGAAPFARSSFLHIREGVDEIKPSLTALSAGFGQIETMLKRIARTTTKMSPQMANLVLFEGPETQKQIPMLGDPSLVTKPTLAIIAEREPEWVIPASLFEREDKSRTTFTPVNRGGAEDGFKRDVAPRIVFQPAMTFTVSSGADSGAPREAVRGGSAPTITITVPVMLDGRKIAEAVAKHEAVELMRRYEAPRRPQRGVGVG